MGKFKELKNLFFIILGSTLLIAGINLFLKPADVFSTGLIGFSQEMSNLIFNDYNHVSLIFWIINLPLIIFGFFNVGKKFLLRTVFAIITISIAEIFIQSPQTPLIHEPILAVITGSILMGIGTGVALKFGGSTGGSDILATYISIIKGKSFGLVNILINLIVIILAIIINHSIETGVYMILSLYVGGIVIDKIHNYNNKCTLFIVTDKKDIVVQNLINNFLRGITILDSVGGYTNNKNNLIMITISYKEINSILNCIKDADPNAFINVHHIDRVVGEFKNHYLDLL